MSSHETSELEEDFLGVGGDGRTCDTQHSQQAGKTVIKIACIGLRLSPRHTEEKLLASQSDADALLI